MLLFDQKTFPYSQVMLPFAITDVLIEQQNEPEIPSMLHFWQLEQTVILGMKDSRLPHLAKGLSAIENEHYQAVVRNAGGLGVVSDGGILNVSLIIPRGNETTDSAYERMVALMQRAFPEFTIEAKEVSDSYCPGKFDLSINDQKIAGIAQRKIKNGIAVMLYLSVNGNQLSRGKMMRHFYQASLGAGFGTSGYPAVRPESMTSLAELFQTELTIDQVKSRLVQAAGIPNSLPENPETWIKNHQLNDQLMRKVTSMLERNQLLNEVSETYDSI